VGRAAKAIALQLPTRAPTLPPPKRAEAAEVRAFNPISLDVSGDFDHRARMLILTTIASRSPDRRRIARATRGCCIRLR
jgi:hypothetical protein